uniref:NADH-ubiquinone oxidoreductase chain 6 n=1 Tax=Pseudoniphargus morenoi TaxID=2211520 RepID=A0A345UDW0_9CRUS|nr:NADH dehydrogenase subunit 6 [Pseudoniphargus morenoi]
MMQLFSCCSIILSMMFLLESSPLFLSVIIIIQTGTLALIISLFSMTSWFSFMLLMIYLSGMMVVFVYISSMASNEMFRLNSKFLLVSLFLAAFTVVNLTSYMLPPSDSVNFLDINLMQISVIKTMKMFSKSLFTMTILLIVYLLLAMIMVVKNSSFSEGPMRSSK